MMRPILKFETLVGGTYSWYLTFVYICDTNVNCGKYFWTTWYIIYVIPFCRSHYRSRSKRNENILNDMADIQDELHIHVPKTTSIQSYDTCAEDGGTRTVDVTI